MITQEKGYRIPAGMTAVFLISCCVFMIFVSMLLVDNHSCASDNVSNDSTVSQNYYFLNNVSVPYPKWNNKQFIAHGNMKQSVNFHGRVDNCDIDIILSISSSIRDVDIGDVELLRNIIREFWGNDLEYVIEVEQLRKNEKGSIAECTLVYPGVETEARIIAGEILCNTSVAFYMMIPAQPYPPSVIDFTDEWVEQFTQQEEKIPEGDRDGKHYEEAAPYPRSGLAISDFHIPLPLIEDRACELEFRGENFIKYTTSNRQVIEVGVELVPTMVAYDEFLYEKGNMARTIAKRDSTGGIYNIYPMKLYESRYSGCSVWEEVSDENSNIGCFYGIIYIDGRVINTYILMNTNSASPEIGLDCILDWMENIFSSNNLNKKNVIYYDIRDAEY